MAIVVLAGQASAAVLYVRSTDGSDADNGTTWALAKATLAGANAIAAAGDTIYVSQVHAETQTGAMTLTSPGTAASPVKVLCGNDGAEPPTALATTATITTTTTGAMSFAGFSYCYGITFSCGTGGTAASLGFNSSSPWWWRLEKCALRLGTTATTSLIIVGTGAITADDALLELDNTTMQFGSVSQAVRVHCPLVWTNTVSAITGATLPTSLFRSSLNVGPYGDVQVRGVDLSAMGAGKSLVDVTLGSFNTYLFESCKLGASSTITTGVPVGQGGNVVRAANCDSADTNYKFFRQSYGGTETEEITIVRTGGASDRTTPVSRKVVTTANPKFYAAYPCDPIYVWCDSTASQTFTIQVVNDGVTLTDADVWLKADAMQTASFPLYTSSRDRAADILATPANQTTSTVAWTTTGLASPIKQSLDVTLTPAKKGPVRLQVMVARPSTTLYYDPLPIPSSSRSWTLGEAGYVDEGSGGFLDVLNGGPVR